MASLQMNAHGQLVADWGDREPLALATLLDVDGTKHLVFSPDITMTTVAAADLRTLARMLDKANGVKGPGLLARIRGEL